MAGSGGGGDGRWITIATINRRWIILQIISAKRNLKRNFLTMKQNLLKIRYEFFVLFCSKKKTKIINKFECLRWYRCACVWYWKGKLVANKKKKDFNRKRKTNQQCQSVFMDYIKLVLLLVLGATMATFEQKKRRKS